MTEQEIDKLFETIKRSTTTLREDMKCFSVEQISQMYRDHQVLDFPSVLKALFDHPKIKELVVLSPLWKDIKKYTDNEKKLPWAFVKDILHPFYWRNAAANTLKSGQ